MDFFKTPLSKNARIALWAVAGVLLAFLIFHAGVVVGSHQGMRPHGGEEGFRPPFGVPAGFVMPDGYMPRGHGAVGVIDTVTLPTMTVSEPNGDVETVFLATTTRIDGASGTSTGVLVPGTHVIIFGDPDETVERINAKVIHLLP